MSTSPAQAVQITEGMRITEMFGARCEKCSARMTSADSKICRECAARSSQLSDQVTGLIAMRRQLIELEAERNRLEAENLLLSQKLAQADVLAVQLKGVLGG